MYVNYIKNTIFRVFLVLYIYGFTIKHMTHMKSSCEFSVIWEKIPDTEQKSDNIPNKNIFLQVTLKNFKKN